MAEIVLAGCTPEPLMSYLKALGVFRLVAEQADSAATLSWAGDAARLGGRFDREGLTEFFLKAYCPTPILAPWNGGSGFYGGGAEPLAAVANSAVKRLAPYRDTIACIRRFAPKDKPRDEQKESLLTRCRAELPDNVVPWLDVCFVLGENGPNFFPLLGTGGNDGRLDFTNNFLQRLADVISFAPDVEPPLNSRGWLDAALFNDSYTAFGRAAVGQFNPGGVGGANGVQGSFEAGSRVNPWDFVLMIEGTLLFAGSVARRLGANVPGRAVFPFSVESVAVGYGSATASEETTDGSRAELWLPLWEQLATLAEIRNLFAEGRAQLGRHQARNAVEFAVAVNLLGVSRGVTAFARYGFLKRNGLSYFAAPLGRVPVTLRPVARLLEDPALTEWIDRFRAACREKANTPARYQTALRNIDRAVFAFATRAQTDQTGERRALAEVLRALGRAERTLASGPWFCKNKGIRPLQGLNPQWLLEAAPAGDGGREFRLAAALASVRAEGKESPVGPFRTHLEEVEQKGKWVNWSPGSTSAVWSNCSLADNLGAVFIRRWMESERAGRGGLALRARVFAPLSDVIAFLYSDKGDDLLADLLWGFVGLDWSSGWFQRANRRAVADRLRTTSRPAPPQEFGLLRLVVHPVGLVTEAGLHASDEERELRWRVTKSGEDLKTTPAAAAFHRLRHGDLAGAVEAAARRLWADRLTPFGWANRHRRKEEYPTDARVDPTRLLAACLFPLTSASLTRLARQVLSPPVP